jgi:hypothetical protein
VTNPKAALTIAAAPKTQAASAGAAAPPVAPAPAAFAPKTSPRAASAATPSPAPAPALLLGDIDGDGRVGRADGRALLDYLFNGGEAPADLSQADLNEDGQVDIADAMQMLAAESSAAPTPPAPAATNAPSPFLLRQATTGYLRSTALPTALRP